MDKLPPLRNIFIVCYSNKFGTECPEKKREKQRVLENISHYGKWYILYEQS
jgi:hypothetical protein